MRENAKKRGASAPLFVVILPFFHPFWGEKFPLTPDGTVFGKTCVTDNANITSCNNCNVHKFIPSCLQTTHLFAI